MLVKYQTAAEFIKERTGENGMNKVERLELENAVLKNVIACVLEEIKIAKWTGKKDCITIVGIERGLDFEEKLKFAMEHGVIDYRCSAKTIEEIEYMFKEFRTRVILNDGMVMGFEY